MKKWVLLGVALILLVFFGLFGLMNSEAGSRWLLQLVVGLMPAEVSAEKIEGRLLSRISIDNLHYQTEFESIDIGKLAFAWQPGELLSGRLRISEISLNGIDMHSHGSPPTQPSTFDWNSDLFLPLDVIVDDLSISDVAISDGKAVRNLQKLQLKAAAENGVLHIRTLNVDAKPFSASATGQAKLGKGYPFSIQIGWQVDSQENGAWRAQTVIDGNTRKINFKNQLSSPFKSSLHGSLDDLKAKPRINARAEWQQAQWPITAATPRIVSEQGHLELEGAMDDYRLNMGTQLKSAELPPAELTLGGKGSSDAFKIERLQLDSKAGAMQVDGAVSWKQATGFNLHASGRDFNPAILLSELPGKLAFDTRVDGELGDAMRVGVDIQQFDGQLRGSQVNAGGRLDLADRLLKVDKLRFKFGANQINADGALGRAQSALDFKIDAPDLAPVWPGLGGNIKGNGHLQGDWQNPAVRIQAKANKLRFAQHNVGQLALDVDYQPDSNKNSTLDLAAKQIKSGETEIATLAVNGTGSPENQTFKASIIAARESLSAQLNGRIQNHGWQADLTTLDINSQAYGRWQLQDISAIELIEQDAGFDARLSETCLIQPPASLCTHGQYLANRDFQFRLKAVELPAGLADAFLPEKWQIKGIVNADANLQQTKGVMDGDYRIEMAANTLIILGDQGEARLGASKLSGDIKGNLVSADMDMALLAEDYVRAKLQLDIGKSQIRDGRISASLKEWKLIRPFIPQVSDLKGLLQADLSLRGAFAMPTVDGRLELKNAAVDLADSGIGFHDLNIEVLATGGSGNRIQLQGKTTPIALPSAGGRNQLELKGSIAVQANLQQDKRINGDYRLDIPAGSSIGIKTNGSANTIAFAASSLAGTIHGDQLSAELDLTTTNQDYLRGQLLVDSGISKALSGQFNVMFPDLSQFNGLAPDMSNIKGSLKGEMALAGTSQQPRASGSVRLAEGAVDVGQLGISLKEINLSAQSAGGDNGRIQLQGGAKSGTGQLRLDGYAGLNGNSEITLNGNDFEVARLPEAEVNLSPDLKLQLAKAGGKVEGLLDIPKAIIKMEDLPESVVKVSQDEVVLGEEKVEEKPEVNVGIDANVEVELGKEVRFSGKGLDTELAGKVRIEQTAGKLVARGTIDMKKARYKSYGQDLTVRKGRFQFNGPIDAPWIDVEAIRVSKDQKVTAILSVTGPLQTPTTRIYSEPSLPESEALAYLITGGPLSQATKGEGNMIANAALSYGAGKLSWLTEKLGVDEFEVEQGDTLQDSLVSVGKYLTSNLYVGTKVGLFNQQAVLVLKRKLTDAINVETQTGTSQRVKLNYEVNTD
ncbi:MAG: translocation/assembly module TamB domain-containing protein [Methylomonas sp.]